MEIDITRFVMAEEPADYSASVAELGPDAGRITWAAAVRYARETDPPLLSTPDQLDAFRDDMRGFGAWDDAEIDAWSAEECNALLAQRIAGDMRNGGLPPGPSDADWTEYEAEDNNGRSGNLYRGDDGRVWYCLGT